VMNEGVEDEAVLEDMEPRDGDVPSAAGSEAMF
jgi:hypothetical protein